MLSRGAIVEHVWGDLAELFIDQTFFATSISDPLGMAIGADGEGVLQNAGGSAITRGVDNYVRLTRGHADLYMGYTYTVPEARLDGHGTILPYTPMHRAAITLGSELGEHWRAGIEGSWNGAQKRSSGPDTPDQWFVATMVAYQTGRWTVALNGENITDTRQTRWELIVGGTPSRPVFSPLWAPIDGRVMNLSVLFHFGHGA